MRKSLPMRLSETQSRKDTARGDERPPPSEPSYRIRPSHRYSSVYSSRAASPLTSLPKAGIYPLSHIVKEPDFRHRPISAPYVAGNKRPETARNPAAKQEESVQRLFKGSRVTLISFADITDNPAFKFSDLEESNKIHEIASLQQRKDSIQHRAFTQSLQIFRELRFDLDFNYDLCRENTSDTAEIPPGLLVTLQEMMETVVKQPQDQMIDMYTRETLGKMLKEFTLYVRTLLRSLKASGKSMEVTLLELIWKLIIKLFDSLLIVHDLHLQQTIEMAKYRVRSEIDARRKAIDSMTLQLEQAEKYQREQVMKLNEQIKGLLAAKFNLEEHLEERQIAITKLQSVTTREESVREMNSFYVKMDRFLAEAESEQVKQLTALQDISTVMEEVHRLDQKQPTSTTSTQTDWTVKECKVALPSLQQPIFSLHPYYSIICDADTVDQVTIAQVLEVMDGLVQSEDTPELPGQLYLRLLLKLGKDFPGYKRLAGRLAGYCDALLQPSDDPKVHIYAGLLGLTRSLPSQAELQYFYRLRIATEEIKQPEGLPYANVLDLVQQGFQTAKFQGCELLAKLKVAIARPPGASDGSLASYVHSEALAQVPTDILGLLGRLALSLEKHKKSWKSQIEALDAHKSGNIQIGQLIEHIVGIVWLNPAEINAFSAYFDSQGTGQIRVADVIQGFDPAAFQQTAHRAFVSRDSFLLHCLSVWQEAAYFSIPSELEIEDFGRFLQTVKTAVPDVEEIETVRLYVEMVGGHQNWREVLAASGCFGRFEVQDLKAKQDKKGRSKRKR